MIDKGRLWNLDFLQETMLYLDGVFWYEMN